MVGRASFLQLQFTSIVSNYFFYFHMEKVDLFHKEAY